MLKSLYVISLISFLAIGQVVYAAGTTTGQIIPLPGGATLWVLPLDDEDSAVISVSYDNGSGVTVRPPVIVCNPVCH